MVRVQQLHVGVVVALFIVFIRSLGSQQRSQQLRKVCRSLLFFLPLCLEICVFCRALLGSFEHLGLHFFDLLSSFLVDFKFLYICLDSFVHSVKLCLRSFLRI